MVKISNPLWKTHYVYYSDKPLESLRFDMEQLFENSKRIRVPVNLTGQFTAQYDFLITPKYQFVTIQNFEQEMSFIRGHISMNKSNKSEISFTVRPNSIFVILFFIFPVFGIIAFMSNMYKSKLANSEIVGFIFTIGVPLLMLIFGHFAKRQIRTAFIKALDLHT